MMLLLIFSITVKCGYERGEIMNNNGIAPNIIDNSPGRELIQVIKDQLKKSGCHFTVSPKAHINPSV